MENAFHGARSGYAVGHSRTAWLFVMRIGLERVGSHERISRLLILKSQRVVLNMALGHWLRDLKRSLAWQLWAAFHVTGIGQNILFLLPEAVFGQRFSWILMHFQASRPSEAASESGRRKLSL